MKVIMISFEVGVERSANDITAEKLKKDITRMLQIYGRSNAVCVDNIAFSPAFRRGFSGTACRGGSGVSSVRRAYDIGNGTRTVLSVLWTFATLRHGKCMYLKMKMAM